MGLIKKAAEELKLLRQQEEVVPPVGAPPPAIVEPEAIKAGIPPLLGGDRKLVCV